jgi:hypothetical protein
MEGEVMRQIFAAIEAVRPGMEDHGMIFQASSNEAFASGLMAWVQKTFVEKIMPRLEKIPRHISVIIVPIQPTGLDMAQARVVTYPVLTVTDQN